MSINLMDISTIIQVQFYNDISEEELLNSIPIDIKRKILSNDKHPFFKAFIISHEGNSNMTELKENKKENSIVEWNKTSIAQFYDKLKTGIKFFWNHNKDNSVSNRKTIGEIVGKLSKTIDNKLSNIIVGYFPKENLDIAKKSNTVSFEGSLKIFNNGFKKIVDSIEEISGIALANLIDVKPGFENATELLQVQFNTNKEIKMAEEETIVRAEDFDPNAITSKQRQIVLRKAKLSELREALEYRHLKPSDLFEPSEIFPQIEIRDGNIRVKDATDRENDFIQELVKKIRQPIEKDLEEKSKKLNEYESSIKSFEQKEKRQAFKPKLIQEIEKKGLEDIAKKFFLAQIEKGKILEGKEIPNDSISQRELIDEITNELNELYQYNASLLIPKTEDLKDVAKENSKDEIKIPSSNKSAIERYLES